MLKLMHAMAIEDARILTRHALSRFQIDPGAEGGGEPPCDGEHAAVVLAVRKLDRLLPVPVPAPHVDYVIAPIGPAGFIGVILDVYESAAADGSAIWHLLIGNDPGEAHLFVRAADVHVVEGPSVAGPLARQMVTWHDDDDPDDDPCCDNPCCRGDHGRDGYGEEG